MDKNENTGIIQDELTGDELISGHDYDGIQELNNSMPRWWLWLFYLSIVFAVIYLMRLYVLHTADTQIEEYNKEIYAASQLYGNNESSLDASNVTLLEDEVSLGIGKAIYDKHCLVCHLAKGEGLVGPNLTDKYWIHGGSIGDLFNIITVGVPSKGMISWKDQLTPEQIQQVASFILSLQGTNPPNAKAPEGEIYKPE
jgi:cytochrome c oxidase cbb3-type subunit 3